MDDELIDAERRGVEGRQSGTGNIARRCDRRSASFAALIHVAHLHLSHVHAYGHGARILSTGDQRQQKEHGKQMSCEVA